MGYRYLQSSRYSISVFSFLVGSLVVSLCGGSGSFMQAAMETGRSCVMFEINGLLKVFSLLSEKQYAGARQRMVEVYRVVGQQKDLTTYWRDREIAYLAFFLRSQQVLYTVLTHSLSQRSLIVPEPKAEAVDEEGEDEIPTPQSLSAEIAGTVICRETDHIMLPLKGNWMILLPSETVTRKRKYLESG